MSVRAAAGALGVGVAAGCLILGVGGRLLMRAVALMAGLPPGFSTGGSLEVIASGALYGAVAGLMLLLFPQRLGIWRPVTHAASVFLLVAITSDAARSAASSITYPTRLWALLAFGVLLIVNSFVLVRLAPLWGGRSTGSASKVAAD